MCYSYEFIVSGSSSVYTFCVSIVLIALFTMPSSAEGIVLLPFFHPYFYLWMPFFLIKKRVLTYSLAVPSILRRLLTNKIGLKEIQKKVNKMINCGLKVFL